MFEVRYVDDFNKMHYTIAKNISELEFIKERFAQVDYTFVEKGDYIVELTVSNRTGECEVTTEPITIKITESFLWQ